MIKCEAEYSSVNNLLGILDYFCFIAFLQKEFSVDKKEYFSVNLKKIMEEKGLTQAHLAHEINTSQPVISKWLRTATFPSEKLLNSLCDFLNIDKSVLDFDLHVATRSSREGSDMPKEKSVHIPFFASVDDFKSKIPSAHMSIDFDFLEKLFGIKYTIGQNYFCFKFLGNSMSPTIHSDSIIITSRDKHIVTGEMCCAIVENTFFIRRYESAHPSRLIPDNRDYTPIAIDVNIQIIGKVIGVIPRYKL